MVLAGLVIALGAIVDDAIVDVENIVRRLRQARLEGSTKSTAAIILDASIEVRGAIVYASFIEVIVLIPVFFLNSLTGSFFKPLASTYALAVMVSLAVALISTPALSLILYSRAKVERHESPLARHLRNGYERIISPIVRQPLPAYVALGVARRGRHRGRAAAGAGAVPGVQGAGLPDALALQAGHVAPGGAPHRHRREQGAALDPRRAELRLPHRPGPPR